MVKTNAMKKIFAFSYVILASISFLFSQEYKDIIIKNNNDSIKCYISLVNDYCIYFNYFDNNNNQEIEGACIIKDAVKQIYSDRKIDSIWYKKTTPIIVEKERLFTKDSLSELYNKVDLLSSEISKYASTNTAAGKHLKKSAIYSYVGISCLALGAGIVAAGTLYSMDQTWVDVTPYLIAGSALSGISAAIIYIAVPIQIHKAGNRLKGE